MTEESIDRWCVARLLLTHSYILINRLWNQSPVEAILVIGKLTVWNTDWTAGDHTGNTTEVFVELLGVTRRETGVLPIKTETRPP